MFRIAWLVFFLAYIFSAYGQQEPNPFDLQYRPRTVVPATSPIISTPPPVTDTMGILSPVAASDTQRMVFIDPSQAQADSNPFEIMEETKPDSAADVAIITPEVKEEARPSTNLAKKPSKGIQIFFLLLSLLFLIFIVNVERSFVKDLWRVISNENYSSLHLRNQRNTMRQILLVMGYFVFVLQAGIFLFHALHVFHYGGTLLDNIWACVALVLCVYLIRHGVIRYLRWLFNNDKEMTLFSFDISIFNIMVGLILLPVNVLLNFGPESLARPLIFMGLIVVSLAYLMRQLRWVLTARHLITNSLFLFFVYLCAVEILPLWAISKFFW